MEPAVESLLATNSAERLEDTVIYFDGVSNRRQVVMLRFEDNLEIAGSGRTLDIWHYPAIRRADSPPGVLRVTCQTARPLARLEIRTEAMAAKLVGYCPRLDDAVTSRNGVLKIVVWSLAATVSIVFAVLFGMPLAADRLAPLVPHVVEQRLGDVTDGQMKMLFGSPCGNGAGQAAFTKLVNEVRTAAELDTAIDASVVPSSVPNAFALPGGKVIVLNGLVKAARDPDEIAGVLAHELGHLKHRDSLRDVISTGGASFLVGLLFGDVTGSSVLIFAGRRMIDAAYTRDMERDADTFSIEVMHRLGRSTLKMGELVFRITGKQGDTTASILANHPLTEDRLERMRKEDRPASGPPLLNPDEWASLKTVCESGPKT